MANTSERNFDLNKQIIGYSFLKNDVILFKLFINYKGEVTLNYATTIASMINLLWSTNSTIEHIENEIKKIEFHSLKIWLEKF